jgi:hypothetical protein
MVVVLDGTDEFRCADYGLWLCGDGVFGCLTWARCIAVLVTSSTTLVSTNDELRLYHALTTDADRQAFANAYVRFASHRSNRESLG